MNTRHEDIYIDDLDDIIESFGSLNGLKLTDFTVALNPNSSEDMRIKNHWADRFRAEGIPFVVQEVSEKKWIMWKEDKTIPNKVQTMMDNRKDIV